MPIIFYGSRGIVSHLASGEFFCPHCGTRGRYQLKQVRRFFTLYFIPLFPIGGGMRFVECDQCGSQFQEGVLHYEPPPETQPQLPEDYDRLVDGRRVGDTERLLRAAQEELLGGTSLGKVQSKLVELGYDSARAEAILQEMCGGEPRKCVCGRRYHPQVLQCSECEAKL
jgi:hypothetical protein